MCFVRRIVSASFARSAVSSYRDHGPAKAGHYRDQASGFRAFHASVCFREKPLRALRPPRFLLYRGTGPAAKGLDPDQAKEAIFPGLHDLMVTITGDRPPLNAAFKSQLVDWYLHRVYEELDGPLTDAISKIPAS